MATYEDLFRLCLVNGERGREDESKRPEEVPDSLLDSMINSMLKLTLEKTSTEPYLSLTPSERFAGLTNFLMTFQVWAINELAEKLGVADNIPEVCGGEVVDIINLDGGEIDPNVLREANEHIRRVSAVTEFFLVRPDLTDAN